MPDISIIIPVYNAEHYIERCISSILVQSFKDFEILLINDGSTDKSPEICDILKKHDPRIHVYHKKNTGASDTRNYGIHLSTGKYLSFIDADDYIAKDMLQTLYEEAEKTNSDMVMCNYYIDSDKKLYPAAMKYDDMYATQSEVRNGLLKRYYENNQTGLYSLCNKLFRRLLIEENKIKMDTKLVRGEDAWFVFDYLKVCSKVTYIPIPLYYYYQNKNSIMHQVQLDQYEKWVYTRKRLLEENKSLKFQLDNQQFYSGFCYKVCIYIRDLIKLNEISRAKNILHDPFYITAVNQIEHVEFPLHIKILLKLVRHNAADLSIFFYKLWAKIS